MSCEKKHDTILQFGYTSAPMFLRYDLHAHSTASDGSLTPTELVQRAHTLGVDVLALTDHDVTDGLAEAGRTAAELGLGFIPGIEISVTWSHQTIHIVGLGINASYAPLQEGLTKIREFRVWRGEEISRRLEKAGITGALEGAQQYSKGQILSRTHFAHFLVEQGHAPDLRRVFKRFLVHNKPGHVPGKWASLSETLSWIHGAGGIAVIAHPARYKLSATRLRQLFAEFNELNGQAIEVVSGSHSPDDNRRMGELCQKMDFFASCGSDFHGPENPYFELGRIPALPEQVRPVWQLGNWPMTGQD